MRLNRWSHQQVLLAILVASVVLRVIAALSFGDSAESLPGTADQVSYDELARRVLNGHGFTFGRTWWPMTRAGEPTAHWSYLYTLYLSGVYGLFGPHPLAARLIQAVIVGVAHPWLAFALARRLFDSRVGLVAAGLTAFYAYFIYYSATVMTEPFYITSVLASLYFAVLLSRGQVGPPGSQSQAVHYRHVAGLGLSLGAAVLLRQVVLLLIPILLLWMWWAGTRKPILTAGITIGIVAALILPLTVYNYLRFDRFVLLNTNAGYAFFWSNHPIYGTQFVPILTADMPTYPELVPEELRALDEASLDQALLARGLQFVLDDPGRYVLLSASRIPVYFMFWPSPDSGLLSNVSRVASFGLLWPFMLYGLIHGLWLRLRTLGFRSSAGAILLAVWVAVYTAVHLLSWALIRYRLPVDAILLVFAAVGLLQFGKLTVGAEGRLLGWIPKRIRRGVV